MQHPLHPRSCGVGVVHHTHKLAHTQQGDSGRGPGVRARSGDRACHRLRSVNSHVNRVLEVIMSFKCYNLQISFTSLVAVSPLADTVLFVWTKFRGCTGSKATSRCFHTVGLFTRWALKAVKSPSSTVHPSAGTRFTVYPDSCAFHFSTWHRVDSARQTPVRTAGDFKSLCSGRVCCVRLSSTLCSISP